MKENKNQRRQKKVAYGYKNLSKAQEDAIRIMKAHGNTLVKRDGFWTYENCEFREYRNGNDLFKIPIYSCRVTTLRVLARRNIIVLNEDKGICKLN